jgi:hypothetical protein
VVSRSGWDSSRPPQLQTASWCAGQFNQSVFGLLGPGARNWEGAESWQAMISTVEKLVAILSNGDNRKKLNKYCGFFPRPGKKASRMDIDRLSPSVPLEQIGTKC